MKLFRNLLIAIVVLIAALLGVASLAGFTPGYLVAAPGVGTGIGAKLLCSARYVSGFSTEQAFADLVQYSPILENLTISYDEPARTVTTSLFGISETTAAFEPGLGCAVEYPGYDARAGGMLSVETGRGEFWPAGPLVNPPELPIQTLLNDLIAQDNAAGLNTRALLVVRSGEIVAEAYAQNADGLTPLLGWSMAKSLTAIMLANLEYRGIVDLDAAPEFAAWAGDDRSEIMLTHLLTMTDGLAFEEQYNPGDDATAMLFTAASPSDYAIDRPLASEPGSRFNYSSGTANILSRVYFEATGASLEVSYLDYLHNIARPMSFQNAVFEVDATGVFVGSSYFYASARDWARMGQLMLNGGEINGQRVVSENWVERATSPNSSANEKAYGHLWWLNRGDESLRWPSLPTDAYAAQGNRQQWVMVIPSRDVVIVRLGWTAGRYPANERFARILDTFETL